MTAYPFEQRADWHANPLVTPATSIVTPTRYLWLHHTGGNPAADQDVPAYLRVLQQGAIAKGYSDLEYTRIRDRTGTGYESRGIGRNTAAQNAPGGPDNNSISHALCAVGNYEVDRPTDQLLEALAQDVVELYRAGAIATPVITGPHKNAPGCSTACCGVNLIACIPGINHRAAQLLNAPTPGDDVPADKDFVDAYSGPDGAWKLQYDGGVETVRGPFLGSYFSLSPDKRNDPTRRFLTIGPLLGTPTPGGYSLVSTKGEVYDFPPKK